jgi:hypothetical protein
MFSFPPRFCIPLPLLYTLCPAYVLFCLPVKYVRLLSVTIYSLSQELARGWRILRQQLDLSVDPTAKRLAGRATICVAALSTQCTSVDVHLRRCAISSVTVNGQPAVHNSSDPLRDRELLTSVSSDSSRRRVDQVRDQQEKLVSRPVPAEVQVFIPPNVSADIIDALAALDSTDAAAAAAAVAGSAPLPPSSCTLEDLPTITVVIEYWALDPTAGAVYYSDPAHVVVNGKFGMARCWMPCVDSQNWCDRCPWRIVVAVPPDLMVICSGDLIETRILLGDDDREVYSCKSGTLALEMGVGDQNTRATRVLAGPRKCFTYLIDAPTHASEIAFTAGPYIPLADPETPITVTHFCLEGRAKELVHTAIPVFAQARLFCNEYFNMVLPVSSFKQVFTGTSDACVGPHCAAGGLLMYSGSLLHDARCIDEGFEARKAITSAIVSCYIGGLIRPRAPEDAWFVAGLATHVSALALASIFGKNWYRIHIMNEVSDMAKVPRSRAPVLADVAEDPLFCIDKATPEVRRRAHIIAYIIERRIGSDVLRRALRDVTAETFRAYAGGNAHDEAFLGLRVGPFLKRIRAICGTDVRNLVRLWAASCGTPRIQFGYRYNGRRHQLEFAVDQKGANGEPLEGDLQGLFFQGSLSVRVMEPEGTFDHTVEVIDPFFVAELSCHSRRTKQKAATQAEKDSGEEFSRLVPISWVRIDPEMEWCLDATFVQTEAAWATMLQSERDAVAQCHACRALAGYGSPLATKALASALADKELYWPVRAEAATALSHSDGGLDALLQYFCEMYTEAIKEQNTSEAPLGLNEKSEALLPNDFSDIAEYMVRRSVVKAVVGARGKGDNAKDEIPQTVPNFIISLLADNDNSKNMFDDDHYVADLLKAAKEVALRCINDGRDTTERVLEQIRRYRVVDRLVPSRSGAVAAALVRALTAIEVAKLDRISANGVPDSSADNLLLCRLVPDQELLRLLFDLSERSAPFRAREAALSSLAQLHGGDLETVHWLLTRVDRSSDGADLLSLPLRKMGDQPPFIESGCVRRAILGALCDVKRASGWHNKIPLLVALRRHTERAMQVCIRILRLAVGDCDERIRTLAVRFAMIAWGRGIPVCFLADAEYRQVAANAKHGRPRAAVAPTSQLISPFASIGNGPLRTSQTRQAQTSAIVEKAKFKITSPGVPVSNGTKILHPTLSNEEVKYAKHPSLVKEFSDFPSTNRAASNRGDLDRGSVPKRESAREALGPAFVVTPPLLKPSLLTPLSGTKELTMHEEDLRYLRRAWRDHKAQHGQASYHDIPTSPIRKNPMPTVIPTRGMGSHHTQANFVLEEAVPLLLNGSQDNADDGLSEDCGESDLGLGDNKDEARIRKEKRRKKKKKRKREEDGTDCAEEVDAHRKRRKKKKKKNRGDDDKRSVSAPSNFPGPFGQSLSLPVASSEGSIRSGGDGKLGIIKIKLGGTQLTSPFPPSV